MSFKIPAALLLTMVFGLTACTDTAPPPSATSVPVATKEHVIVIGRISEDPSKVIDQMQPFANYLAEQLQPYGITVGDARIARSTDEMAQMLSTGEVDLYLGSVFPAILVSDQAGARPILIDCREGVDKESAVIFANAESGINRLADLPGNMIAMDTAYSTSGFLLPTVFLLQQGLTLHLKPNYGAPVGSNEVGLVFSNDETNTIQWVLSGLTPAGVMNKYHYEVALPPDVSQKLVVLAHTEAVPGNLVVASANINTDLLESLKSILLGMPDKPEGQAILTALSNTKFIPLPPDFEQEMNRVREMANILHNTHLP